MCPIRSRCQVGATLAVIALGTLATGCGSVKTSGTARTGTEQLLLTNAWDDALRKVDFRPLTGVPVYLDTQHINAVDQGWVISSIRQQMLAQGVLLRAKPEQAQWVVEARIGAYGTDEYNWMIGVPQTTIPPTITGVPNGTIPELPLVKKNDQHAIAKLAMFAYDRTSGQIIWRSGTMLAHSSAKDIYVGGVGPIQSGTIWHKKKRIGVNLPMISEPGPVDGEPAPRSASAFPNAPTMALPASASDLESFAPGP